ncbi:MAG: proprotein convertase P-domain-containing protein [Saprospiraceae bacterium]|nr:proprotein convertase P-domain-containing protein [Saprospiraceae bacterium]
MAITLRTKALLMAAGLLTSLALSAQNHPITQGMIRTCGGFFLDSGGNDQGYNPDENYTATICSDGSTGTHVQLTFSRVEVIPGDSLCFYDGNSAAAPPLSCIADFSYEGPFIIQATAANPSGCITVVFKSNATDQGSGWSADINCIQSCQTILSEIVSATPAIEPADTGWIDLCPSDRVTLSARGIYPQNGITYTHSDLTSEFMWEFGDGSTAVGPNVSHEYRESGGYIIQLIITDAQGCRSTNFINQRVRVAPKPTFAVGDSIPLEICSGDTIALNSIINEINRNYSLSVISNEATFQAGAIRSDSLALPDGTGNSHETSVKLQNFSPGQVLENAGDLESICVNMEHTWLRDLEIRLFCPNGQSIILHNFGGRSGSEVYLGEPVDFDGTNPTPGRGYDYCWTNDAANTWLEYANANSPRILPSGDYSPYESFQNLIGCPLNGEWTIEVLDSWAIDNGFIFSWGINFNPNLFPELEKFKPNIVSDTWENNPTIFDFSSSDINASPLNAGSANYVFQVTDDFGCVFDTSLNIKVLPPTHPNCRNCSESLRPAQDTIICEGETVAFNVGAGPTSETTTVTFESFPQYSFGNSNHPPSNPYNANINVNSIFPATITNVNQQILSVCMDIETDFLSDLRIFLISPSGQSLELTTGNGGSTDFYTNTCFSPTATTPITTGTSPFTGTYRPEGNWNVLNGATVNGNWSLRITDALGTTEMGILKSWSITFQSTNTTQYTWTPGTGLSCTNCPNPVATPSATTNYVVRVNDNYNCGASDTVTVNVVRDAPAPVVSCGLSPDSTALVFDWSAIPGASNYEVNVIKNGTASGWQGPVNGLQYSLDDLINNDTVSLEVRLYTGGQPINCNVEIGTATCAYLVCELDIDSLGSTPVDCFGNNTGTAFIAVSGGMGGNYRYLWNDTLRQIEQTAIFLEAGTYRVVVRDEINCIASADITVEQPDSISITTQVTDALCVDDANGSIASTVNGGVGTYTYSWSNGQTNANASNLTAGDYTLSVTDANGCMAQARASVDEPDNPVTITVEQTFKGCSGERNNEATITPAGGTGAGYTFNWSNGQTTAIGVDLDSINYAVTVSDANGCQAVESIKLQDWAPIVPNIIMSAPLCNGDTNGALGVNIVTGGAGQSETDYTFQWSTGQTGNAIRDLAGGITYTVTVTDIQGCIGLASRLLEQPPQVSFEIKVTEPLCFGSDNGSATVTNLVGQGTTFSYRWDQNAKNQTTQTATNLIAGSYTVTVTDAKNCRSTGTIAITQPSRIESLFDVVNNKCFGEDKGVITSNIKGGTPGYTFAWSNNETNSKLSDLVAGTYTLTVTDANNCIHTTSVAVDEPDQLSAEFKITDATCNGDRDGRVSVTPIGGTGPYQYSLDNKNFSTTSTFIALKANDYKIYVKDANGCTYLDRAIVGEPAKFIVDAGDNSYTIRLGDSLQLTATSLNGQGFISYAWSAPFGNSLSCSECETVTAAPQDMIIYELYGIDEKGCEATDRVTIVVQKIREVAVPTGFTPNADGSNDLLLVHGLDGTRIKMFRVYDRWGELLYDFGGFMVNDKNSGWDGNFRGKPMNSGVYIWYLEVEYIDGMTEALKGQTTLIR